MATPAHAALSLQSDPLLPKTRFVEKPIASSEDPVLLSADRVDYDQTHNIVKASGNVSVAQGETVLLADMLVYDQQKNVVTAAGNISMLDASGNVMFADAVELSDNLKAGVIDQFAARLADNSVLVANRTRKIDENVSEMFKLAYSPCHCTENGRPVAAMWRIRAKDAVMNEAEQKITYHDAYFSVYDVPVLYTPYFSNPMPGADNQSGLLTPEYKHTNNLGSVLSMPVYYAIAPDRDLTVTPIYTTLEGLVMLGEYRQKFDKGQMILQGSITRPTNIDAQGNPNSGHEIRGHVNAVGKFNIDETYDWGFDLHRTSDDTYLRRYNFGEDTLLTSRIYAEGLRFPGLGERSFGIVQALSFQGLTAQDVAKRIPLVLPIADFSYQTEPGLYHSRFTFDGNLMSLYRQQGADSRRLSTTVGWTAPYITQGGQVFELTTQLRGDAYSVADVLLSDHSFYNGTTGRLVPQASLLWRYPFIKRWDTSSLMIEPIANLTVSPGGGNPEKIPNEDSLVPEFTDTNLFSSNRFAGLDRIEVGPRISYGLRGQAQLFSSEYINWLFGQQYRVENDPNFPISNDLTSHFSDYVGKIGVNYRPVTLAYRFRLDKDEFTPKRSEVDAGLDLYPFRFGLAYLSLTNDPVLASKEAIVGNAILSLSDEWTLTMNANRDLELDQMVSFGTGLTYRNECTSISALVGKTFIHDRDLRQSLNFIFQISLKNLN